MRFLLYKCTSENEKVDKTLTDELEMNGALKDESDVIDPDILIETENPTAYNYAYIPRFGRYYYVREITSVRTGLWRISLHVDVLYTYRTDIRNCFAIVNKQQSETYGTDLYNDGSFRVREDNFTELKSFPNGFNENGTFILLVAGAIEAQGE